MDRIENPAKAKVKKVDQNKVKNRELAKKMLNEASKDLIPTMKKKVEEISKNIEKLVGKEEGLIATQIELIIANRSLNDVMTSTIQRQYTPEELMIGLELYRQVIAKINEKITYPPSVYTFCSFMNMSSTTYKGYKTDPDRAEVMQMIDDYIAGTQFTSAQLGKLKEITTIFGLKSVHGFYEAQAPIVVKQDIKVDIDEIQNQIKELSKGKVIDVEYSDSD